MISRDFSDFMKNTIKLKDVKLSDSMKYKTFLYEGFLRLKKHREGKLNKEDNISGIEDELNGEYLDQMIDLNRFMNSTASTNYPSDPSFQNMFIDFNIDKGTALKLAEYLNKMEDIFYVIINPVDKDVICKFRPEESIVFDFIQTIDYDLEVPEKKQWMEDLPLVKMTVEDVKQKRRTLYEVLLEIFKEF